MRVKCLAQEHNTMSPVRARTRTPRSGHERTNYEATIPPMWVLYPGRIEIWKYWLLGKAKNRNTRNSQSSKPDPQMAPGRNKTRATLMGVERTHHCAIPGPHVICACK